MLRMEDLDGKRAVPGMAQAILQDLAWLGINWDVGPDSDETYMQSRRSTLYEAAVSRLRAHERIFPCTYSRRDLERLATAPHGMPSQPPYPAALRPRQLPGDWFELHRSGKASLRFKVADELVTFQDRVYGMVCERVSDSVGDFVVKRRDGVYAYQLAVVVDDVSMGITEVVRGEDLISSTARQIQLIEALGESPPAYGHVPLVVAPDGVKLSKRHSGLSIRALRAAGVRADTLVGYLAYTLGLLSDPVPCSPADLVPGFSWQEVHRRAWTLPRDLAEKLLVG